MKARAASADNSASLPMQTMLCSFLRLAVVAFALFAILSIPPRGWSQTANRVVREVDSSQVQALPNHLPAWANTANHAGLVPSSQVLNQMTMVLARSPQQEQAFESFLTDQQNPASPDYHRWLTPAEVGERFGVSLKDIAAVSGWMQSQGLHVNWVSPSRLFIGFGGTAGDMGRAFQTEFHYYNVNGAQRMSVSSDPMVPVALAPAIKAITGLYTVEDRPAHHMTAVQSASPQITASNGSHFIAPADFSQIYDFSSWSNAGAGQTIGIVGRSRTNFADFNNFQRLTSASFNDPTEVVPTAFGGVDPGPALTAPPAAGVSIEDQSEATLDVLRSGSVALGAKLLLVVSTAASGGIETDAQYLVQTTPVPVQVMSISFGECESAVGPSRVAFWDALFQQGAAEGISSFVSSGDAGASGCDTNFGTPPASPAPNSPNYICSSSYATCVGGTEFADSANPSQYWSSTNGSTLGSAYSYIPEGGWNEPLNSSSSPQAASSGGGVSTVIATPSWQTGTGVPAARSGRYTPDLAFSSSCHDGYFGCFAAGGASCVTQSNGSFEFVGFCGTSAAAPSMAGIAAMLNQQKGGAQGNLNQGLYLLAASNPAAFHDVTVSTSGVTNCSAGTPSMCNNSVPGPSSLTGGQAGYLVTDGYDQVTGLGSLNVAYFLSSFTSKLTPVLTVASSPSITVLQSLTVTVAVGGPSGQPTPTGSVVFSAGSYSSAAAPLSNGSATIVVPAGSLGLQSNLFTVMYTPDSASAALYSAQSATGSVYVAPLTPVVTVTPASLKLTSAQALTVTVGVNGGSANPTPTGAVYLQGTGYYQSVTLSAGSATYTIAAGILPAGNDTLNAYYVPDAQSSSLYGNAAGQNTVTITATAALTPAVTVTPSATTMAKVNPLTVTIAVSGGVGNPTPTGSITLMSGYYTSAATTLNGGSAAITVPGGTLVTGSDLLTAVYAPDAASTSTYNNASGSSTISVWDPAKSVPIVTIFPSATAITTAQPLSVTVTASSNAGYPITTGSVTLASGGYTSAPAALSFNEATIIVPAGSLAIGNDTLIASYTPDATSSPIFFSATGSDTITVSAPVTTGFAITGTAASVEHGATTGNTSTITVTPTGGFTGAVTLTAAIASSPNGAQDLPSFSFGSTSPVSVTGTSAGIATLTIYTTASSGCTSSNTMPRGLPWSMPGGAALAFVLLFGIPARQRQRWRTMLSALALLVSLCTGMMACGGGGGGSATCTAITSGTTAGAYTITVTGVSGSTSASGTFTLNVQ